MLWTDGFGETHDVVRFYVPGDEADWATYVIRADGWLERLMAMGPVFMRTARGYATIEQAAAAVEAAHREWLERDTESWRQASGVLAGIDTTRPAGAGGRSGVVSDDFDLMREIRRGGSAHMDSSGNATFEPGSLHPYDQMRDELKQLRENQQRLARHIRHLRGHLQSVAGNEYTEATLNAMARMDGVAEMLEGDHPPH